MFLLSDCPGSQTQPCSLQPLKEAISVLFSFTRRVLDDTQFQTDIHHWLERLVYIQKHTLGSLVLYSTLTQWSRYFDFLYGSGPLSRWQSCCILEDLESTYTCCAICCVVLLGWASGQHLSFRLVVENSFLFIVVMSVSRTYR